jgi:16S rRNA (adenine1518-N6/adenine1519-N6)-dimethyltransferase
MATPISSRKATRQTLKDHQLRAKKKYGQNFLVDNRVVEQIALLSGAQDQVVIEVGPGLGALTEQLAKVAHHVYAYEIDEGIIPALSHRVSADKVTIRLKDFLETTREEIEATNATVLAGNLPYYITTPILFHVLEDLPSLTTMTIMVQKEVAERFVAQPSTKAYGALSVILQTLCRVKTVLKVKPGSFMPIPNVDSAVVRLDRYPLGDDPQPFFKVVKAGFTQRRKTLANNLKGIDVIPHLRRLGHPDDIRAEALSPSQWLTLYRSLHETQSVR